MKTLYFNINTGANENAKSFFTPKEPRRNKDGSKRASDKSVEEQYDAFLKDAALDPMTGKILVIHCWSNLSNEMVFYNNDEESIITAFWIDYAQHDRFVTHNGNNFDWPFIIRRSLMLGIEVPLFPYDRFKFSDVHVDMAEIWNFGRVQSGTCVSLRNLCKAMGVDAGLKETNPEISENFEHEFKTNYERTMQYAADEVRVLRELDLKINKGVV